ncbi:M56 family metallopeptidase [Flavobacterium sp. 245]|uniref:M56 family metallopeptidase n=1 Tax=Flavobacterium sp. 245 TaxID=2512115 RepID=UPI0010617120|nr:M56 family metallopeptidase [Flavobacterium sp. 245]TDP03857.1 beta-lactamase regulating signal transducer with metallopeptidase domain [Flavobacterium sp. 245]
MIDFLIKSTIALGIFLAFYHLILEREKIHQFNRFFLLFSIIISFVIPFITFEIIREIPVNFSNQINIDQATITPVRAAEKTDYKLNFLWSLYAIITLLFSIRFGRNIWAIMSKSSNNPIIKFKNSKLVLVDEKILPYTFLNYIFVNSDDYKKRNIEEELYAHELVHVTQKHTIDILFIELLKTIFWFNPLFVFYKKAIQLNHEFLADQEIVKEYNNVPFYQKLLLEKGSGIQPIFLASNLNYLVTKKRLIMMTKRTSRNIAVLKKMAIVPVFMALVTFLCVKIVAQETKIETKTDVLKNSSVIENNFSKTAVVYTDKVRNTTSEKKDVEATPESKKEVPSSTVSAIKSTDIIVDPVDRQPEFPGGILEFYKFVGKNFKSPADKIEGKIIVEFMIETDGSLSEFQVVKDLGFGLGDEAIRVLKLSPKWNPGIQSGQPVRVLYTLPITIQSEK